MSQDLKAFDCQTYHNLPFHKVENASGTEYARWAFRYKKSGFPYLLGAMLDFPTWIIGYIVSNILRVIVVLILTPYIILAFLINGIARFFSGNCNLVLLPPPVTGIILIAKINHLFTGTPVQMDIKDDRKVYLNAIRIFLNQYSIPY